VVISFTTSKPNPDQATQVESFLAEFLPRLAQQPGVVGAYHFTDAEAGESTTVIVWRDDAARMAYRDGQLIRDAQAFEAQMGLSSTRRAFPLSYPHPSP